MVARPKRLRKVLAFTLGGPEVPSTRLRILGYRDRFRREGVRFIVHEEGATGFWRRLRNLYRFLTADVLLVQKRVLGWRRLLISRLLGKRIAFDIDDATFVDQRTGQENPASYRALRRFLRHCHLIVLCNRFLEQRLTRPGQRVLTLLTVPPETHPSKTREPRGLPRLGWVGTADDLPYLEALDGILCKLQARYPFELTVIGPREGLADLSTRHRYIPWSQEIDRSLGDRFDVGIMPLPDNDWTRSKCGYKVIQYQSFGIPAVASPVGINAELVEHGVTGLLARDEREWHDCLELLLQNPALVALMSGRIQARFQERFSAESNFRRLLQALREIVAEGRGGAKP